MDKKKILQISLISLIILITILVYFFYFKNSGEKILTNNDEKQEKYNLKSSEDLITEMTYFSEDNKGNSYEIKSESGVINPDKSNLILMNKVKAIVYLINNEKIFISSNAAKYNDSNNDTTFSGSVEMVYVDHKINSEHLDLSFKDQTAVLYDNVNYKNNFSHLIADKILIDFFNKNTKILMNDKNNNILVRSVLSNGNN
tara:strand:+ start:211 stop:810 length:600 start_codon:yes stop_codon:yes gene_type:complete